MESTRSAGQIEVLRQDLGRIRQHSTSLFQDICSPPSLPSTSNSCILRNAFPSIQSSADIGAKSTIPNQNVSEGAAMALKTISTSCPEAKEKNMSTISSRANPPRAFNAENSSFKNISTNKNFKKTCVHRTHQPAYSQENCFHKDGLDLISDQNIEDGDDDEEELSAFEDEDDGGFQSVKLKPLCTPGNASDQQPREHHEMQQYPLHPHHSQEHSYHSRQFDSSQNQHGSLCWSNQPHFHDHHLNPQYTDQRDHHDRHLPNCDRNFRRLKDKERNEKADLLATIRKEIKGDLRDILKEIQQQQPPMQPTSQQHHERHQQNQQQNMHEQQQQQPSNAIYRPLAIRASPHLPSPSSHAPIFSPAASNDLYETHLFTQL